MPSPKVQYSWHSIEIATAGELHCADKCQFITDGSSVISCVLYQCVLRRDPARVRNAMLRCKDCAGRRVKRTQDEMLSDVLEKSRARLRRKGAP